MSAASLGLHELVPSGVVSVGTTRAAVLDAYLGITGLPAARLEQRLAVDGLNAARASEALSGAATVSQVSAEVDAAIHVGTSILHGASGDAVLRRAAEVTLRRLSGSGSEASLAANGLVAALEHEGSRYATWLLRPWDRLTDARASVVVRRRLGHALSDLGAGAEALVKAARADRDRVIASLGVDPVDALDCYVDCVGDKHGTERSWLLRGHDVGVFLKPRSGEIDSWYSQFVGWVNAKVGEELLRAPSVLLIDNRSWASEVARRDVAPDDVSHVFRRYGALLAVMEFLGATDIHSSNVVVDGRYPVPVDLECLFHPFRPSRAESESLYSRLDDWLSAGPLRTGLLPLRRPGSTPDGIDSSALGGPMDLGPNRASTVMVNGTVANPADFADDLLAGYEDAYETIGYHAAELTAPESFFLAADGLRVRYIHWDTSVLNMLRDFANGPEWSSSGIDRSVALDRLWHAVDDEPIELVSVATRSLFLDVIPRFEHLVGSTAVVDGDDRHIAEVRPNGPRQSLDRLRDRAGGLLPRGAEVEMSIRSLRRRAPSKHGSDIPQVVEASELRAAGASLLAAAVRTHDKMTWLVPSNLGSSFRLAPSSGGLYDGLAGMAIAFDALSVALPGEATWPEIVDQLAATILADWSDLVRVDRGTSPFVATAGAALYLALAARSLTDRRRAELVDRSLAGVRSALVIEESGDFLYGTPGLLRVAAAADARLSVDLGSAIESAGSRLHSLATIGGGDLPPWSTLHGRPVQGLAHGVSGVLLGLASLPASWDGTLLPVIQEGMALEDTWIRAGCHEWSDQRSDPPGARAAYPAAWCTGAVGIGLARILLAERWGDQLGAFDVPQVGNSIRVGDVALCHGWSSAQLYRAAVGEHPMAVPRELEGLAAAPTAKGVSAGLFLGTASQMYALARLRAAAAPDVLTLTVAS